MKRETSEGERLVSLQVPNKEVVSLLHSSLPPTPYGVRECSLTVDVCLCVSVQLCNAGVELLLHFVFCRITFKNTNQTLVYPQRLHENLFFFIHC